MADDIELVSDGDGLAVIGDEEAVERFLYSDGLLDQSQDLSLNRLANILGRGAEIVQGASEISAKSGRYVKLTKVSAERRATLGLMPTKTKGISHAMVGDPGHINKWLQIEDGPSALLTNPAVLSGAAGMMAQLARQQEAKELKALLVRIDGKLDELRRSERDRVLEKLDRVVESIDDAMFVREYGGDGQTAWQKVVTESGVIAEVRAGALRKLEALADKITHGSSIGTLAKSAREIEEEVGVWLAVLARCFQLDDKYKILELDHVLETAPSSLESHRLALNTALNERRKKVSEQTHRLVNKMEETGGIATSNIILHPSAALSVVNSSNHVGDVVEEFHRPIEINFIRDGVQTVRWRDAIRDPQQLKSAGSEAGRKSLAGVAVVGGGLVITLGAAAIANKGTSDDEG